MEYFLLENCFLKEIKMETSTAYTSYLQDMKNLQTSQGRIEAKQPYEENFEKIYEKAQAFDVKLNNAKDFLNSLSDEELATIQHYKGLVEAIDSGNLNQESAYNLLVHDNEQYDFNGDNIVEVGAAKTAPLVPKSMPSNVRSAFIEAMNSLPEDKRLLASLLTFDIGRITAQINHTPYIPPVVDYAYLQKRVDSLLNPQQGAYTSPQTKEVIQTFWDSFNAAYHQDTQATSSQEEQTNPEVEKFLKDLTSKGAIQFLADLNQEKIDKLVEEYKQKLIDKMGDTPEAMKQIESLVAQFKKQLLEQLEESIDNDDTKMKISSQAMVKTLLSLMDKEDKSPFGKLIKED